MPTTIIHGSGYAKGECQKELMAAGKAYPRTCDLCGIWGPCQKGHDAKPAAGLFDVHPLPWQLGEQKTGTCEVCDANWVRILTVRGRGSIVLSQDELSAHDVASELVRVVNSPPATRTPDSAPPGQTT
jgi:hypothetical protein